MSIGRVIGTIVVILVLYAVITQPTASANTTRNGVSRLGDAGHRVTLFLSSLVTGAPTTADGQVSYTPAGGAATGDGSSQR